MPSASFRDGLNNIQLQYQISLMYVWQILTSNDMGKPISIDTRLFNFKWIDIRWSKLIGMEGMAMIIYYTIKSNISKKEHYWN